MKRSSRYFLIFTGILILAGLLRLPRLSERPMHLDEAVHGIKFGMLLEEGRYIYDAEDFHGPSLNYLTLPFAWLSGQDHIEEISETTLRSLPALAGLLSILMLLLLVQELGWATVLLSALLMALSPALAYYSRYYIQETLLVCFCFGLIVCGIRALRNGRGGWYLGAGVFGGLAIATKETWILHFYVLLLSVLFLSQLPPGKRRIRRLLKSSDGIGGTPIQPGIPGAEKEQAHARPLQRMSSLYRWLLFLLPLVLIPVLLYGSFFKNVTGITDAISAYTNYFERAGSDPDHLHPWHFYLTRLSFARGKGMIWSEAWILLLAMGGAVISISALRKVDQRLSGLKSGESLTQGASMPASVAVLSMTGIYGLLLMLVYSLIPYKTPWLLLNFFQVLIIPAGYAIVLIWKRLRKPRARTLFSGLAALLFLGTLWQARQTVFVHHSDPANPYVYAHSTEDVFEISETIHQLREKHPDAPIEVVYQGHEYWPLPWYLRDLDLIGWWEEVDLEGPAGEIVLADPSAEPSLLQKWYEIPPPGQRHLYVPLFDRTMEIRHGAEIRGYIRRDMR